MPPQSDLEKLRRDSMHAQLRALRDGHVSARQLLECTLTAHARLDKRINAIPAVYANRARTEADAADAARERGAPLGVLHGLPMSIKDAHNVAGMPTTMGLRAMQNNIANHDMTLVARLRRAGAIVWGKSNLPVMSYDWQARNPLYGTTENPWLAGHCAGGSSGGAAAALAAGLTAAELGSDIAGSIRVPASFCGVVGLRPSEGLLTLSGLGRTPADPTPHMLVSGPMARHVADVRVLLEVLLGPDPRSLATPGALPGTPYQLGAAPEPGDLRGLEIGVCEDIGGVELSSSVLTAFTDLRTRLVDAGAKVVDAPLDPVLDARAALHLWARIQGFEFWHAFVPWQLGPLRWLAAALYPRWLGFNEMSRGTARGLLGRGQGYLHALARRDDLAGVFDDFLARFDLWIAPVSPIPAFPHQQMGRPLRIDGRRESYGRAIGIYNCPLSLLGVPAVALPIARSPEGLPIGAQLVGRRWNDRRVLALAERIEAIVDPGPRVYEG